MSEQMDKGRREDNYSLEDILAEYKGNAHIADESNPPAQETHSRAEEIIGEERASESPKKAEILEFRAAAPEKSVEEAAKEIITREIGEYFEEMESRSREKYEPPKIRHIRDGTPESEDGEGREENPQELGLFGDRKSVG